MVRQKMAPSPVRDSSPESPVVIEDVNQRDEKDQETRTIKDEALDHTGNDSFENQVKVESGGVAVSTCSAEEPPVSPADSNIIDWEPEDPQNPKHWRTSRKWMMVSVVSINTLLTALGSTIPVPGVPQLMKEFHSDNGLLEGFVVSVYVLGFAVGPLRKFRNFRCHKIAHANSDRATFGNLWSASSISHMQCKLPDLEPRLCSCSKFTIANGFPFSRWQLRRSAVYSRRWYNRRHGRSSSKRYRFRHMDGWTHHRTRHRPCHWRLPERLPWMEMELLDPCYHRWSDTHR